MKPSRWNPLAVVDADQAADWYAERGGVALELAFIDALQATLELIENHPGAGSSRHADLLPALGCAPRFHPVRHFDDYLVYYTEFANHVQVIRIWHAKRGLDALFQPLSDSTP